MFSINEFGDKITEKLKTQDLITLKNYVKNNILNVKLDFINFQQIYKIKYKQKTYQKIKLYINDTIEIILIIWGKNTKTKLHQHPKNGCILFLLSGELTEHRYLNNNKIIKTNLPTNSISYIHDDIGQHIISSISEAISIHIYSPPGFYD